MYRHSAPTTVAMLILAVILAAAFTGCGGSSGPADPVVTPPPPAHDTPFTPTPHDGGYAAYLVGGTYNASYLPPDGPDHFTVAPGTYKPVCLRPSEIGTSQMHIAGGMDWQSSFTDASGGTIDPTPDGWPLAPGICTCITPNPAGGVITFVVHVVADTLGGLKVRMIPVDGYGNRFTPDANNGNGWKLPIVTPFRWVAEFTRDGAVVTQTRYSASARTTSNSVNVPYSDGYYSGTNPGIVTYAVYVYDNTGNEMGGNEIVVDNIIVNFYYIQ